MNSSIYISGSGYCIRPVRFYIGYCRCCGAVVRASRMLDTDECADCLEWRLVIGGAA